MEYVVKNKGKYLEIIGWGKLSPYFGWTKSTWSAKVFNCFDDAKEAMGKYGGKVFYSKVEYVIQISNFRSSAYVGSFTHIKRGTPRKKSNYYFVDTLVDNITYQLELVDCDIDDDSKKGALRFGDEYAAGNICYRIEQGMARSGHWGINAIVRDVRKETLCRKK